MAATVGLMDLTAGLRSRLVAAGIRRASILTELLVEYVADGDQLAAELGKLLGAGAAGSGELAAFAKEVTEKWELLLESAAGEGRRVFAGTAESRGVVVHRLGLTSEAEQAAAQAKLEVLAQASVMPPPAKRWKTSRVARREGTDDPHEREQNERMAKKKWVHECV